MATTPVNGNGSKKSFWMAISFIPVALVVGAIFHSGFYVGNVMANTRDNRVQDATFIVHTNKIENNKIGVITLKGEVYMHYKEIITLLTSQSEQIRELKMAQSEQIRELKEDIKDLRLRMSELSHN